jgi:hypothetical protein
MDGPDTGPGSGRSGTSAGTMALVLTLVAAVTGVADYQQWNSTILSADAADINCADVH